MKICWIHPTSEMPDVAPLFDMLHADVRATARPDTEIEFRYLPKSGCFTRSMYAEHMNSVLFAEAALQAQADGFDAVYLGCWNDPLYEAREALTIPVGSVGEQSMMAAMAMGKKFGVITVSEKTTVAITRDIEAYGFSARAIPRPARSFTPESDACLLLDTLKDARSAVIPRFEEVAKGCIADGAEVILTGCTYYGPMLRAAGYTEVPGTGVTVLDATTASFKYLEAMTDLYLQTGYVKSERLTFRTPPTEKLNLARGSLGLAS
ncbi:aspartate/glutamate racemase family protein [Alloyangia pacifica]|uniref:aspartate/glutamate racemase family protein n=1 Tax=Alloyangia pacifica TaxID=311180 RepID=UPI001CFEF3E8|nr:aspartate/glutamate racemase family protein [Alloyangia pacifica]